MKFLLTVACVVALWALVAGQGTQMYCGRRLADTLAYLCPEVGTVKRGDGAVRAAALYGAHGWRWPSLGGARGKRGVVEECCYKGCSLDELLTYC